MQPAETRGPKVESELRSGSTRWLTWVGLLLLFIAALFIRLHALTRKPFWFDECFSAEVARVSWGNFVHLLWWREANMSLYYLLLRMWLHFGQSEFFIRTLSALISAATVPAIFWLGGLLYDRRVAWIAALLLAVNAYSVRYAQEARSYALFLLLTTLSSACLMAFLREPTRPHRVGYIVASVLAVYAHFYGLLLVAVDWLALKGLGIPRDELGAAHRHAQLRRAWIVIGVALLPLLVFIAKTGAGPLRWIPRPGLGDVLDFYQHLAGGNRILLEVYGLASIAAVAPLGKHLLWRRQDWDTWRCQFLILWLVFPVLLALLLSFARPVFLGRYMIFCLPALLILAARGMTRLPDRWLAVPIMALVFFLGGQGLMFVYGHDFDQERDASGRATEFILDHSQTGDGIIFHIAEARLPYEFFRWERAAHITAGPTYQGQLGPDILFPRHGSSLDYHDFTGKPTAEFLRSVAPGCSRIWLMLMNNGPVGNPDTTTVMLTKILPESFREVQHWEFPGVEVRLYSKR
jgi:mannosyltransferase